MQFIIIIIISVSGLGGMNETERQRLTERNKGMETGIEAVNVV